jgi:hypothetical protein
MDIGFCFVLLFDCSFQPDDWDDELDGEWEAPKIDNPKYKGAWKPKQIANPVRNCFYV